MGSGDRTGNSDAGLHLSSQAEMLSLDAAALMVQLNFRLLLEVRHSCGGTGLLDLLPAACMGGRGEPRLKPMLLLCVLHLLCRRRATLM